MDTNLFDKSKFFLVAVLALTAVVTFHPNSIFAEDQPVITVVNPLRGPQLGLEKSDLLDSLHSQWSATKDASVSATWLWQYSALEQSALVKYAKDEMRDQEFGVFLEIDKNTADKSGVEYKGKIAWYHSDGLLLVSYDKFERQRLIDHTFKKFKETFGYYPKSVGAWWVGAQSIQYMQQKYGISAVLQCADQFNTDAYSLWGTPWSIPYVPSIENAGAPANNKYENNLVMMQWAPRDPVEGYGPTVKESTFSLQDYSLKSYSIDYFTYLRDIYLKGGTDQIVFGLEGGMPAAFYGGQYKQQLLLAKQWEKNKKIQFQTMEKFADRFLRSGKVLPETSDFLVKGYTSNHQSYWTHTQNYRIGIIKRGDQISVIDIRDYANQISEDFYILPNTLALLKINTLSLIDSVRFPAEIIKLGQSSDQLKVVKSDQLTKLTVGDKTIAEFTPHKVVFRSIDNASTVYNFNNKLNIKYSLKVVLTISILIAIAILVYYDQRKFLVVAWSAIYTVALFPIITSGWVGTQGALFDEKTLNLLKFTEGIPFAIDVKLFVIYQVLPLVLTLTLVSLALKKLANNTASIVILILVVVWILSQYNLFSVFSELTTNGLSKREIAKIIVGLYLSSGVFLSIVSLVYLGKARAAHLLSIGILALVIFNFRSSIFSEHRVILTNFEINALEHVRASKKNVTLMHDSKEVVYRAIVPLTYRNNEYLKFLTNTQWHKQAKEEIDLSTNDLIFVPNFLNQEINHFEEEKFKLSKEFDNAQITIYSKIH